VGDAVTTSTGGRLKVNRYTLTLCGVITIRVGYHGEVNTGGRLGYGLTQEQFPQGHAAQRNGAATRVRAQRQEADLGQQTGTGAVFGEFIRSPTGLRRHSVDRTQRW